MPVICFKIIWSWGKQDEHNTPQWGDRHTHALHYTILSNGSWKFSIINHEENIFTNLSTPLSDFYPFWISTFKFHINNILNQTLFEALNDRADFYLDISINIY